jgi:hypothetical protein
MISKWVQGNAMRLGQVLQRRFFRRIIVLACAFYSCTFFCTFI